MDDLKNRPQLTGHFQFFVIDQDGNQLSKCAVASPTEKMIYELIHQSLEDGYIGFVIKKIEVKTVSLSDYLQSEEMITQALIENKAALERLKKERQIDWEMLHTPMI